MADSVAEPPGERLRRDWPYLALAAIATAVVLLVVFFAGRAFLLIAAGILEAVILYAASGGLARLTGLNREVCLIAVFVAILLLVAGLAWLVAPGVVGELRDFAASLVTAWASLKQRIADFAIGREVLKRLQDSPGGGALAAIGQQLTGSVAQVLGSLLDLVVVVMLGFYLAANPGVYLRGALHLVPRRHRPRVREVVLGVTDALRHWMLGELFQMALIGVVCGVGDWLLGVPQAIVLGVIAGLTEFIPNIGPILGAVPAVLVAFGADPTHAAYVAAFYAVVQGLEGNILTPMVQQRAVDLPPVLTLGFQLVMGLMAGFLGLLIAVPLAACVMTAVRMAYVEDTLDDSSV